MNYKELKLGKHGLPTWDSLIPIILRYFSDDLEKESKKIAVQVSDSLDLPDRLREAVYVNNPSSNTIEDRTKWCISELYTAGAIERPSRGVYKISPLGMSLLKLNDSELTRNKIHSSPQYQNHQKELIKRNEISGLNNEKVSEKAEDNDSDVNVVDKLCEVTEKYNNKIASNLLKMIQESDPNFFEQLVVKLLIKMGYKGPNGSSRVTQKTNDGGIDGIINQDPLGTSTVYLQAKRYKDDNVVQRPAIDGFYGALSRVHADRGVFITTSHFSSSAMTTAKNFSIVLIDGIQLTNLMLQYHVGVQVKKHLDLFEIDEDFFED